MSTLVETIVETIIGTTAWKGKRFLSLPNDIRDQITDFFLKLGCFDRLQIERIRKSNLGRVHQFIPEFRKIDLLECAREMAGVDRVEYAYFATIFKNSAAFRQYIYKYVPYEIIKSGVEHYVKFARAHRDPSTPRIELECHYVFRWILTNNPFLVTNANEIYNVVVALRTIIQ